MITLLQITGVARNEFKRPTLNNAGSKLLDLLMTSVF